jgi:hypothetical protein
VIWPGIDEPDRLSYSALPESADEMPLLPRASCTPSPAPPNGELPAKSSRSVVAGRRGHIRQGQFVPNPKHTPPATQAPSSKSQLAALHEVHHTRYVHMGILAGSGLTDKISTLRSGLYEVKFISHIDEQLSPRDF